jgi:hypothetical protein
MSTRRVDAWRLGLLAAVVGCSNGPAEGSRTEGVTPPVPAAASASAPTRFAPWATGERHTYGLKLTSTLAFGKAANAFDFDLTSKVIIAPAKVEGGESSLFVVLADPKIESRVPGTASQFATIAQQLSQFGCFFSFKDGRVIDMHLAPGLPAMVVSIYRQLGAALQIVTEGDKAQYQSREYDGTGEYKAEYTRIGERAYKKRKLAYLSILAKPSDLSQPAIAGIIPEIVASSAELRLAPSGRPLRVSLEDELKVNGAQLPVHNKTLLELDAETSTRGEPVQDFAALGDKLVRLGADEPFNATAAVEALDDARIHGQTFEGIVARLKEQQEKAPSPGEAANQAAAAGANERAQQGATEQSALFVALAAVFRKDPTSAALAAQRARSTPSIANTLIDAMGSSGSPTAHAALAELLTAKGIDPKLRLRALTGLARTPVPSPAAIDALKAELKRNPFSTGALYGLGSYAMYFRDAGDAAQEKAIGEVLLDRLAHADDIVPRLIVTLGGITNSGYLGALSAVTQHLQDRRPGVRAAAVRALQFMISPQIDPLIASSMTADTDLAVTLAALDAVQARAPSDVLIEALSSVAQSSPNPNARYKSVDQLTRWGKTRPALRELIQRVATNDPEERVRALAQSAL